MTTIELPVKLISEANWRGHWRQRHKRATAQKAAMIAVPSHPLPCLVTITRLGPRTLDDDNLAGSAKAIRDSIAARLGVDDGDTARIQFRYAQEKSKAYGVRITLEPMEGSA